jgi:hypothetical protein
MSLRPRSEPREDELAALADGSLSSERRADLEAQLERSPELRARLDEQRRILATVHNAVAATETPARLHARIHAARTRRAAPQLARPLRAAAGLAAAAAAVAVVLSISGGPGAPSVADAAVLAARPATAPAPAAKPAQPTLLARSAEGVLYPNWARKFGWRADGARTDTIHGRTATTVFYRKGARRLGYTIVSGAPLRIPRDALRLPREGTRITILHLAGKPVATWLRNGHTCVLAGADLPGTRLADLAGWTGKGTVPF